MTSALNTLSRFVPRGARIVVSPGCGTPTTLLTALATDPEGVQPDVHVLSGLLLEDCGLADAVEAGRLGWSTWHPMGRARQLIDNGQVDYLPLRGSGIPEFLERIAPEVALVRVSPPDRNGYVSLGPSVSYPRRAIETAAVAIAEVDPAVPRTGPHSLVHQSRFAAIIDSELPMPEYLSARGTAETDRIAQQVLQLVPPAAVVQVGIGAVPEQLVALLAGHEDVGFVGMGSDAMIDVVASQSHSSVLPIISAVELMGTSRLMQFADHSPLVEVLPSEIGHSVLHLGRFERLISVNGAAQVDLSGQVASEQVGGRHISGVGGSQDFAESARLSRGGLTVIATTSTAGSRSRIVPRIGPGDPVTLARHVIDVVVTEQGVADLRGLSEAERCEALIGVAHPDHRDALRAAQAEAE
ncbi:acetyl-CoA hydrolase/transferase family protein [Salinibacterium sp. ZJ450]|uniref:acetyl-CoA hydrolase/transferase family protein n=1 Tax=Salinibacterium sp. ZJ450 TaxID=2708338 RepID=UPI00141D7E3E|nr:DUF5047 domain-containing protein [Salinibacterium sp. ZJ450]